MPAASLRSFSRPYANRESHANPYETNNLPLQTILRIRKTETKEQKRGAKQIPKADGENLHIQK